MIVELLKNIVSHFLQACACIIAQTPHEILLSSFEVSLDLVEGGDEVWYLNDLFIIGLKFISLLN